MSTLQGTDAAETIAPGNLSPTVTATEGPLAVTNGADTINAGGGNDVVDGGGGNDRIFGGAGDDLLLGGTGNDFIDGDQGNDIALLGAGNDTFEWNPGDGSDVVEGGDGTDTMDFFGSAASEVINVFATGARAAFTRNVGNINMDLNDVERVVFRAGAGADTVIVNDLTATDVDRVSIDLAGTDGAADGAADLVQRLGSGAADVITVRGGATTTVTGVGADVVISGAEAELDRLEVSSGAGNDVIDASSKSAAGVQLSILAGAGDDVIVGSRGNDFVNGGLGADVALLGAGDDVFQWLPGEGSDTVEGQGGTDTLDFDGSAAAENFDITANGDRAKLFRNVGNITMDLDSLERIELDTRAGTDNVNIGDLRSTDVREIEIDLAGAADSAASDGVRDNVTAAGRASADTVTISGNAAETLVNGLPASLRMVNGDAGLDTLTVNTNGGNDNIDASALVAAGPTLTIDAGAGNDTIVGSQGNDVLLGGAGNDNVRGGRGNDVAFLGDGNDIFTWAPGEGSDVVEGQAGTDTLDFDGANVSENISISANGERVNFFRDIANINMDLNDVERVVFDAAGGADNITIGDLTGTDADEIVLNLGATLGSTTPDGLADRISAAGTAGADAVRVANASGGSVQVTGLAADVRVTGADATLDTLELRTGAGNDTLDASGLSGNRIQLRLFAEGGDDRVIGSAGADFVNGGLGSDNVSLGAGDDRFQWNPGEGSDVIDGQQGFDTHEFNGSAANERMSLVANGNRATLTRDVGNIVMDQDNFERVEITARAGADSIEIGDLSGTDVREVSVDLAAVAGGTVGDGLSDLVGVNGSSRSEFISVTTEGNSLRVAGLAADSRVTNLDAADRVEVRGGAGNDVIQALLVPAGTAVLNLDGGAGNDVLVGSQGADTLDGGTGNDLLFGGAGDDTFLGDDDFTVVDFHAGAGSEDRIDLRAVAGLDDFADVQAAARSITGGVVLDFGDDEITLVGVNGGQLVADDFLI